MYRITITFTRIAFQAILIASVFIAFSYFNDWLKSTSFFGDNLCDCKYDWMDTSHSWGYRHYVYFLLGLLLVVLSLIRLIVYSGIEIKKLEDNLNNK